MVDVLCRTIHQYTSYKNLLEIYCNVDYWLLQGSYLKQNQSNTEVNSPLRSMRYSPPVGNSSSQLDMPDTTLKPN